MLNDCATQPCYSSTLPMNSDTNRRNYSQKTHSSNPQPCISNRPPDPFQRSPHQRPHPRIRPRALMHLRHPPQTLHMPASARDHILARANSPPRARVDQLVAEVADEEAPPFLQPCAVEARRRGCTSTTSCAHRSPPTGFWPRNARPFSWTPCRRARGRR